MDDLIDRKIVNNFKTSDFTKIVYSVKGVQNVKIYRKIYQKIAN